MAKPEWGTKRICQSCSAPFYDLQRSPIVCPKCAAVFDPEAILKSRKLKGAEPPAEPVKKVIKDPEDILDAEDDEEVPSVADDDTVLEDASDLDDNDVSEVIETSDDKDKDET